MTWDYSNKGPQTINENHLCHLKKYKGTPLKDIPSEYLSWMAKNLDQNDQKYGATNRQIVEVCIKLIQGRQNQFSSPAQSQPEPIRYVPVNDNPPRASNPMFPATANYGVEFARINQKLDKILHILDPKQTFIAPAEMQPDDLPPF